YLNLGNNQVYDIKDNMLENIVGRSGNSAFLDSGTELRTVDVLGKNLVMSIENDGITSFSAVNGMLVGLGHNGFTEIGKVNMSGAAFAMDGVQAASGMTFATPQILANNRLSTDFVAIGTVLNPAALAGYNLPLGQDQNGGESKPKQLNAISNIDIFGQNVQSIRTKDGFQIVNNFPQTDSLLNPDGLKAQIVAMSTLDLNTGTVEPFEFNTQGLGSHYQNLTAGRDLAPTPLGDIQVSYGEILSYIPAQQFSKNSAINSNAMENGLFIYGNPGEVKWRDGDNGVVHSWNPGKFTATHNINLSSYQPLFEPKASSKTIGMDLTKLQAGESLSSRNNYSITGMDLRSTIDVKRISSDSNLVALTSHPVNSSGGMWEINTLNLQKDKIGKVITDGYYWSNKANIAGGVDASGVSGLVSREGFNYDAFKRDINVIPTKSGYALNLAGTEVVNGMVLGPGMGENYIADNGSMLPSRIVNGVAGLTASDKFNFDYKGTDATLITNIKGDILAENYFVDKKAFSDSALTGDFTQKITGTNVRLDDVNLALHDFSAQLLPTGQIKLITPDALTYSYSHLLKKSEGNGQAIPNLGKGVVLDYIKPVAYGADVNVHRGLAGILVTSQAGTLDFSPTYSQGAVWKQVPEFATKTEGQTVYADRRSGVHNSPDTWVGSLANQQGFLRIGENGKFYGDASTIKAHVLPGQAPYHLEAKHFSADLSRLDIVNRFGTVGSTKDNIGSFAESILEAKTNYSTDWHMSYAVGTGEINKGKFNIFDIGVTKYSNGNEIPTLGVASNEFRILESVVNGNPPVNSSEITYSSFRPELTLSKVANTGEKLKTVVGVDDKNQIIDRDIFRRVNITNGANDFTGIILNPATVNNQQTYFNEKGKFVIGGADISSLSLSGLANWHNAATAKFDEKGRIDTAASQAEGKYLLALSTNVNDDKVIRNSVGVKANTGGVLNIGKNDFQATDIYLTEGKFKHYAIDSSIQSLGQAEQIINQSRDLDVVARQKILGILQSSDWEKIRTAGIDYTITSWAEYRERGVKGDLVLPSQDVIFGGEQLKHKIGFNIGEIKGISNLAMQKAGRQDDKIISFAGWNALPFMPQGLTEATVVKDGKSGKLADGLFVENTQKTSSPILVGEHEYTISDRIGGVLLPKEGSITLTQIGLDDKGQLSFNPLTQAGNLKYNNVKVSETVTIKDGVTVINKQELKLTSRDIVDAKTGNTQKVYDLLDNQGRVVYDQVDYEEAKGTVRVADTKWADGSLAMPWNLSLNVNKDDKPTSFDLNYLGGANSSFIKFDANSELAVGAGQITSQHALNLKPVEMKSELGGTVTTVAPELYRYSEWQNGKWESPEGRTYFAGDLNFKVQQSVNGTAFTSIDVAAQDTRMSMVNGHGQIIEDKDGTSMENMLHYLVKGVSFARPDRTGGTSGESSTYILGYDLDNKSKVFPNEKGILTAKESLMPVLMGLDKQGDLNFNVVSLAKGLSYQYQSAGTAIYGNLRLSGVDQDITVDNGKVLVPDGQYAGTETRGDLTIKGEYKIAGEKIDAVSQSYYDKAGKKLELATFQKEQSDIAIDQDERVWNIKTGLLVNETASEAVALKSQLAEIKAEQTKNRQLIKDYIGDAQRLAKQAGLKDEVATLEQAKAIHDKL
ncbi:MAG: hypothetical protein KJ818_07295, partial [Candidatus Omnitrophica bacterium]|nr:hypothetical protein [Candidatus Omnitrophota bacterium]